MILSLRAQAEHVANGVGKLRAVECEEVEMVDTARMQLGAKFGSDGCGDELSLGRAVVEPIEHMADPCWDAGPAALGELAHALHIRHGQDAGYDLHVQPQRRSLIAETEEAIGREEELRDGASGAGIDLAPQIVEIGGAVG
jgi:hypothetical protein